MLCTRCQQREAKVWPAEMRAEVEAKFGIPWPFPDDICKECLGEWFKTPEAKAKFEPFRRAMNERMKKEFAEWWDGVRSRVLKVLDVADGIAGKF